MKHLSLLYLLICAACEFGATGRVYAHGFAGARFFPATLSTDDPFVADELSLPTVSTIRTPEDGGTRETDISVDISKRITPDLASKSGAPADAQSAPIHSVPGRPGWFSAKALATYLVGCDS